MFEVLAIDGGYFYAGVVLEKGRVVEVAPILRRRLMGYDKEVCLRSQSQMRVENFGGHKGKN